MIEKRLRSIAPRLFTADGKVNGSITLASTRPFKVKQEITISAIGLPTLDLEVKKINIPFELILGPRNANIAAYTNLTAYTTALSAAIFANEQKRPSIPFEESTRAVYDEEPTVAKRNVLVDQDGEYIDVIKDDVGVRRLAVDADVNIDSLTVAISYPGIPTIANIPIPLANTEYLYVIPTGTKQLSLKDRDGDAKTRIAYVAGDTAVKYATVNMGNSHDVYDIATPVGLTIYLRSNKSNRILEITSWA